MREPFPTYFSDSQLVPSVNRLFDKLKRFSELFLAPPKKGFNKALKKPPPTVALQLARAVGQLTPFVGEHDTLESGY